MWQYNFENNTYCTYNGEHRHRKSPDDVFGYHVGQIARKPKSFVEECINSAKIIRESTTSPITILYSGGIDSEIVMESFRLAGIRIRAVFCRYEKNYNQHDLKYAKQYCEAYNVKLDIIDLDLIKFWENDAYQYAELVGCQTPQLLPGLWLIDQIDGCVITGSGDIEFRRQDNGIWRDIIEESGDTCWSRFAEIRQREIISSFLEYTPEQIYANLHLPWLQQFILNKIQSENNTMCNKPIIYGDCFDLRPRPKFTGFELVDEADKRLRRILEEDFKEYSGEVHWTWNEFVEQLEKI